MSNRALTWAFEQPVEPAGAKFVLVALADGAGNEDYSCIYGQEKLARMTGQGVRTVRRHLEHLKAADLVVREKRKRKDGSRTSDRCLLQIRDNKWPDCLSVADGSAEQTAQANRPDWTLGQNTYRPNCADLPANLAGHEPLVVPNQKPTTPPPPKGGTPPRGRAPPTEANAEAPDAQEHVDRRKARSDGTKRGTRLDSDWQPDPADRAYARGRGFSEAEIDDMAASFSTHFTAGSGRNRTWVRWSGSNGAWGNWVRRETPKPGRGYRGHDAGGDRRGPGSVVAAARRVLGQG